MSKTARVIAVVAAAAASIGAILGLELPKEADATIAALLIAIVGFLVPSLREEPKP